MKSLLKIAAASLGLVALAAVATPALAGPTQVELRFGGGYYPSQSYVQPGVVYESQAPVYRYQDPEAWRAHAWRERERREHEWRERNEWRERQLQAERWREHEWREERREHDGRGEWR